MSRRHSVPQLAAPAEEFVLTEQHIALLRRAQIVWHEAHGPEGDYANPVGIDVPRFNPIRPYGNSNIEQDIADICGVEYDPAVLYGEGPETDALHARLMKLHQETMTALQIVLATGGFQPGHYFKQEWCPWTMVPVLEGNALWIAATAITNEMHDYLTEAAHAVVKGGRFRQSGITFTVQFTLDNQADVETALAYLRQQRIMHGFALVERPKP